jgi:hypothetical protein
MVASWKLNPCSNTYQVNNRHKPGSLACTFKQLMLSDLQHMMVTKSGENFYQDTAKMARKFEPSPAQCRLWRKFISPLWIKMAFSIGQMTAAELTISPSNTAHQTNTTTSRIQKCQPTHIYCPNAKMAQTTAITKEPRVYRPSRWRAF